MRKLPEGGGGRITCIAYKRDNMVDIIMTVATIMKYALTVEADESEPGTEEELEGTSEDDPSDEGDVTEEGEVDDEYDEEYDDEYDGSGRGWPLVTLTPKKPSAITKSSAPVMKI